MLVDPAIGVLAKRMKEDGKLPALALSAAKDVLDRNGFKPTEKHDVSVSLIKALRGGDVSELDDDTLELLTSFVETLAFGDDRARMLAEKRRVLIEAGAAPDVIEAEFSEVEENPIKEDEEEGW
jgi:hypothetical protein